MTFLIALRNSHYKAVLTTCSKFLTQKSKLTSKYEFYLFQNSINSYFYINSSKCQKSPTNLYSNPAPPRTSFFPFGVEVCRGFLTLTKIDVIVGVCRILERVKDKMKDLDLNCEKSIFTSEFRFLCQSF